MQVISFVCYKEKSLLKEKEAQKILATFSHSFSLFEEYQDEKVFLLRYRSSESLDFWQKEKEKLFALCANFFCDVSIVEEGALQNKPKLFVTDMDSTLIQEEVIDEIADFLNIRKKISQITEKAMSGKINFDDSLQQRVKLLKGVKQSQMKKIIPRIHLNPGAEKLVSSLKKNNVKTALVSGGFQIFTLHFQKLLGFDYQFSNELQMEKDEIQGRVKGVILNGEQKKKIVETLCQEHGVSKNELIVIGDGANDMLMISLAAFGIGFYPKPLLQKQVFSLIRFGDLDTVLYFTGLF